MDRDAPTTAREVSAAVTAVAGLGAFGAQPADERRMHEALSAHREKGEWFIHVVDGGSGVLTPTTKTGFTTLTLTAVYDWGALIWDGSAWRALAYGGTAAFA